MASPASSYKNNIFWNTQVLSGTRVPGQIAYSYANDTAFADCGQYGNLCATTDPFVVADVDHHLAAGSPCINAGDNSLTSILTDFEGTPRGAAPGGDGFNDIGWDEK